MDLDRLEQVAMMQQMMQHVTNSDAPALRSGQVLALIDRLRKAERVAEAARELERRFFDKESFDITPELDALRDALDACDREED